MVPTKLDNDKDGKPDMMSIDIVRPKTAPGVRVPVILESSPYNFNLGRGAENQTKKLGPGGVVDDIPLFYDNYFRAPWLRVRSDGQPGYRTFDRLHGCLGCRGCDGRR